MTDQATQLRTLVNPPPQPPLAPPVPRRPASPAANVAVSYGPMCPSGFSAGAAPAHLRVKGRRPEGRDQRSEVRGQHSVLSTQSSALSTPPIARAIAICSGKGGVGKSNIAVNLAAAMSSMGLKVCLLDADLGLANADVLCNVRPRVTLQHVVNENCRLTDAMILAPGGFRLIPGASGVARLADLNPAARHALLQQFAALERTADVLLIDCGAGISANVVGFANAADSVLVAVTPEPTAITDGYATIKTLIGSGQPTDVSVVVNMAASHAEGPATFNRINAVCRLFLSRSVRYAGAIPMDNAVTAAVRQRMPFVLHAPDSAATHAVRRLAANLAHRSDGISASGAGDDSIVPRDAVQPTGFFSRLAVWLGLAEYVE